VNPIAQPFSGDVSILCRDRMSDWQHMVSHRRTGHGPVPNPLHAVYDNWPSGMYENAMTAIIDLRELNRYLNSDLSPDDCMGLSDLDGFLTAIVIGPELIMPSE
jgi:hypothetical protein